MRIILKEKYTSYEAALEASGLECLVERRERLCLKFAKACLKNDQVKDIFPLNETEYHVDTREREAFKVTMAKTERLKRSAVPHMQRLLNNDA